MNIEETKKIIQNKIQADEAAREVRSQIKTYIYEKQNAREGFTETFKPLIETSEKVKESIDTQQNKLIKQLQENQLALSEGLDKNRLAITSGFDKMDEVKKWDIEQLPGYEAIEEPETEELEIEEEGKPKIVRRMTFDEYIKEIENEIDNLNKLAQKAEEEGNMKLKDDFLKKIIKLEERISKRRKEREELKEKKLPKRVLTFDDTDLDSGLNNAISIRFLEENDLLLPSRIKNESYETIKRYQRKAERLSNDYKKILANKAEFKIRKGKNKAVPLNKNPRTETLQEIQYYNILGEYVNNMNKLENISRKKEGKGIIHFNNPQQLVKRLELLAGSILAGNNGVKQEFSQIAHLLHQLKVITKKTLNDLLKKYILFK